MPYLNALQLYKFGPYHQLQQAHEYSQYQASTQIWNNIIEPEQDIDPYPWIIWYIWKARNDKLFRGIDRDPLELVRHAESECQVWFNAKEMVPPQIQDNNNEEPQVISLGNIYLLDGSWTSSTHFSGCGWVWMDSSGNIQLMGARNFTRRESALHSEETHAWPNFGTELERIVTLQISFSDFNITYGPRARYLKFE
uniref:RNase H type-1 domain-containing protein n=1 Tax=Brassica oleracea var. oleracea TaxID=109376 RepID=A0A0D3D4P6_BRAOL